MTRSPLSLFKTVNAPLATRVACAAMLASLAGCSLLERATTGDKVDYKSTVAVKKTSLDVPPDLTQLTADNRYAVPGQAQNQSVVSASSFKSQVPPPAAAATPMTTATSPTSLSSDASKAAVATTPAVVSNVAPDAIGNVKIQRSSDLRWLATTQTPEQVWPQLQQFWQDRGFTLSLDQPDIGVMETDWAENRAKLPNDLIRNTLGRVIDSLYSTGERDRFRTRVERTPTGSEIYVTHRGMVEVYTSQLKDTTTWQPRPADPQLEAEFLSRMLVALGKPQLPSNVADNSATDPATVKAVAAASAAMPALAPARARVVPNLPSAAMQVDEKFDRAWRGVGLALDRSGFTIEDRDRGQGLYFVRYVDPALAGKDGPNIFSRIFSLGRDKEKGGPARYRVVVKEEGVASTVTVQDANGAPEKGEAGQRIVAMLVDDMK